MLDTAPHAGPATPPPTEPRRPMRLRALLYEARWRRADLGRAIGLSPTVTSRIFDGIRPLRLDEGVRLSRALSAAIGRTVIPEDLVDPTE